MEEVTHATSSRGLELGIDAMILPADRKGKKWIVYIGRHLVNIFEQLELEQFPVDTQVYDVQPIAKSFQASSLQQNGAMLKGLDDCCHSLKHIEQGSSLRVGKAAVACGVCRGKPQRTNGSNNANFQ
eukprot:1032437-Amphidinium_carterae.2